MMFGCHRFLSRPLLPPTGCLKEVQLWTGWASLQPKNGTKTVSTSRDVSRDRDSTPEPTLVSTSRKSTTSLTNVKPHRSRAFLRPTETHLDKSPWTCCNVATGLHQSRCVHQAAPHLSSTWSDFLSLENESRCRRTLEPNLGLYDKAGPGRPASILVTLCCVGEEPAFLFTLRSSQLKGRHKGDVSFAGGKCDPADKDVVATAVREAREEIGITVTTDQVWGVLKPLADRAGTQVAPVLAYIGAIEKLRLRPNPGEVDEIFTLSLSHLCDPQNRGYTNFRRGDKYSHTLPVFHNGKHKVWGLTAVALSQTLKLITPS